MYVESRLIGTAFEFLFCLRFLVINKTNIHDTFLKWPKCSLSICEGKCFLSYSKEAWFSLKPFLMTRLVIWETCFHSLGFYLIFNTLFIHSIHIHGIFKSKFHNSNNNNNNNKCFYKSIITMF